MKKALMSITIAEPCTQNWQKMEQKEGNRFCGVCNKSVIDFTGFSDAEIIQMLSNRTESLCGRLSMRQLNQLNYRLLAAPKGKTSMKYLGVLAIGASIFVHEASASVAKIPYPTTKEISNNPHRDSSSIKLKKVIYGYIFSGDKIPVVGLKLKIKGTDYTTTTDKNGRYEFRFDSRFDAKFNTLLIEDSLYNTTFTLNYSNLKQSDYYPTKEYFIMGKITMPASSIKKVKL